ncbi:MAG: hypothetical protein JWM18_3437 [Chloroflexi bacterium]|jgi:hypothetical protein|nr:hypothetical protein [Chloroflexota bacterium]
MARQTVPVTPDGGPGVCDGCGAQSEARSVVHAYAPKYLCDTCSRAFVEGDDAVVAAVFAIVPEDTSARSRRRQHKSGR